MVCKDEMGYIYAVSQKTATTLIIRPHRMHGMHRCGLLLQMWCCLSACVCVCGVSPVKVAEPICLGYGLRSAKGTMY